MGGGGKGMGWVDFLQRLSPTEGAAVPGLNAYNSASSPPQQCFKSSPVLKDTVGEGGLGGLRKGGCAKARSRRETWVSALDVLLMDHIIPSATLTFWIQRGHLSIHNFLLWYWITLSLPASGQQVLSHEIQGCSFCHGDGGWGASEESGGGRGKDWDTGLMLIGS